MSLVGLVGLTAYLIAMHALITGAAHPARTLALIVAPWVVSAVVSLARGRVINGVGMLCVIALLGAAAWLARADLGSHVEALLYAENLFFVGSLSCLFGHSLSGRREPLVTRLARLVRGDDMPPAVIRYTRRVTVGWSVFFASEAVVSTVLFVTQDRATWSAFVNLLQWPLVIVAFAVEYAVRLAVLRGVRHSSPLAGVRTFARRDERVGESR